MGNLFGTPEAKVGVLVVIVITLLAIFSVKISEDPGFFVGSKKISFVISDASGLVRNGHVKMAGIDVGTVKDIKLEKGQARVEMQINSTVPVTRTASIEIRPNGILGDKYVEIVPGNPEDPDIPNNGEILTVSNRGSLDALMKEVGKIAQSVGDVAENLNASLKDGGENNGPLGRIIHNIDRATADIAEITTQNKQDLRQTMANLKSISQNLNDVMSDPSEHGFKASWEKVATSIDKLDATMANVEEITDKLNKGKGTLGRLLNDEKTVDELNTAITSVNSFMGGANKLQTSIDLHSEVMMEQSLAKTYFGVRVQPGLDRYYDLQIVDDPKGVVERTDITNISNPGPGQTATNTREIKTFKNKVKFTALYAKNFWDFTVRGGLMESSGGGGLDWLLLRRKLKLSFDAFEFSNPHPHLRTSARYSVVKGVYLIGGWDDFVSDTGTKSTFIGAGIDLTNDDLKTLLGKFSP